MFSKLTSKIRALVGRDTTTDIPNAHSTVIGELNHLAASDSEHPSTFCSPKPEPNIITVDEQQDAKSTSLTISQKMSVSPDVTESNSLENFLEATVSDPTDIEGSKGIDKTPDEQKEAGWNSDDDRTEQELVLSAERHATYRSNSRPSQQDRFASQNAPEEEQLVDLAKQSFASTRLINLLHNTEVELPAKTVAAYMRAPDAVREAFRQLQNFGEETATELDDLVRKFVRNFNQDRRTADDRIVDVVQEAVCSVRLLNAINANSHRLPVNTVSEYMKAPAHAREAFLKLPSLGRKSADELDIIMRSFVPNYVDEDVDAQISDAESYHKSAIRAAEAFFSGLRYPDEIFEWSPQARLSNLLEVELEKHPSSFFDFIREFDETTTRLRSQKNCGQKSIEELEVIVSRLIEARLSLWGAPSELEPELRSFLRGESISQTSLDSIIELGSIKPEDIKASERASIEELTVNEIIEGCISTLNDKEQDILQRRYAINREQPETLEQVASDYDVTRERIRQIEKKAKQKLETKRTKKILIVALEQEGSLEKLFKNRKVVSDEQIGSVSKMLTAQECLAVDLAYGDMRSFLDAESVRTDVGWVQEHDQLVLSHEPEDLSGSLRQRIVSAIQVLKLPIRLSEISASIPDFPLSEIKSELSKCFDATFQGDFLLAAPRLPSAVRCILILREAGHAMHCDEIRARMHEVFSKDDSIHNIGATLARLEEALIVERGTYDLYENLSLTDNELQEIRDRTLHHLENVGGFISAKVLLSDLFRGETERFGISFGPYMLLGILQDDERFLTKRGLMVALATDENKLEFRGLSEEILDVLKEASGSMTLDEIAEHLEGRRDVLETSISHALNTSPEAVLVGRGRFDLTLRAIGDYERQAELILACALNLAGGDKTVFALSEILSSVWGEIQTKPLLNFLKNRYIFEVDQKTVSVLELPEVVSRYVEIRDQVLAGGTARLLDLDILKNSLQSQGAADLTRLDYCFSSGDEDATQDEEVLAMILGDFGID